MNILIVSSYLPYPLFSGGHIRLYNLMKGLSKKHSVTLICEKREYQTEEDVKEVSRICQSVITVPRKKQWTLGNILRTGFSSYPFLMVGHTNSSMRDKISDIVRGAHFDLIHVETFYVMQNLPDKTALPIVLVEHNIEYLVYDLYRKSASFFLQPLLAIDIAKMKYWEKLFWKKATRLVAVSESDKRMMGRADMEVVPNGVDVKKFQMQNAKVRSDIEERVLFIGDFRWIQNRDAVEWIIKEIWPKINGRWKTEDGKLILWIVGKNIPDSIKRLTNDPDVIFDEHAPEDTSEIYAQSSVLLAPIRVGGGTSFKILEAMASGVPVVTTSLGIEGLEVADKREVLIGESEEALADCVIEVLRNEALYKRIAQNAQRLVEKEYDWKIIIKKLEQVYDEVTRNSREY